MASVNAPRLELNLAAVSLWPFFSHPTSSAPAISPRDKNPPHNTNSTRALITDSWGAPGAREAGANAPAHQLWEPVCPPNPSFAQRRGCPLSARCRADRARPHSPAPVSGGGAGRAPPTAKEPHGGAGGSATAGGSLEQGGSGPSRAAVKPSPRCGSTQKISDRVAARELTPRSSRTCSHDIPAQVDIAQDPREGAVAPGERGVQQHAPAHGRAHVPDVRTADVGARHLQVGAAFFSQQHED